MLQIKLAIWECVCAVTRANIIQNVFRWEAPARLSDAGPKQRHKRKTRSDLRQRAFLAALGKRALVGLQIRAQSLLSSQEKLKSNRS